MNGFDHEKMKNASYTEAKEYQEIGSFKRTAQKRKSYTVKQKVSEGAKAAAKTLAVATAGIIIVESSVFVSDPVSFAKDANEKIGSNPSPSSVTELVEATEECVWDEGTVMKESSCTEKGILRFVCKICGKTREEDIPLADHTVEITEAVEPTCTEAGHTEIRTCSVCGEVLDEGEEIPALGHDWGEEKETKKATCTAAGEKQSVCSRCGEIKKTTIKALGHVDSNGDYKCDRCGTMLLSMYVTNVAVLEGGYAVGVNFALSSNVRDLSVDYRVTSGNAGIEGGTSGSSSIELWIYAWDDAPPPYTFSVTVYSGSKAIMTKQFRYNSNGTVTALN